MKAIANTKDLFSILSVESEEWKRKIYNTTGVIPVFQKCTESALLFSNCGYIDLDSDAEYHFSKEQDMTEYCTIQSISEFIEYIQSMESYKAYLVDSCLGTFSKADLFWGIWTAIITAPENLKKKDGSLKQEWSISSMTFYREHLTLQMVLIDYDMVEIWIDINNETTLEEALCYVVEEMNIVTNDIEDIPEYRLFLTRMYQSPRTYEELYAQIAPDGEFNWLTD